jgi:peptidyl-prolyl cis-trans isomerase B (cyclophilin B)
LAAKSKNQNIFASAAKSAKRFEEHQRSEQSKIARRANDNRFALLVSVGAVALAVVFQLAYFGLGPGQTAAITEAEPTATPNSSLVPSPELAQGKSWDFGMSVGDVPLEITLDGAKAPQAVSNFLALAGRSFYNDLNCHRLTTDGIFVLQCGDPNGDGTGGPGYTWGPIENAPADGKYLEGYLAMARRSNDGASMGSQFFIVYKESNIPSDTAGGYSVFGKITAGLDGLDKIIKAGTKDGSTDGAPASDVKLGPITVK